MTAKPTVSSRHCNSTGATLMEVMIAMIILAIMATAGAAYLHFSRASLAVQRNKRTALEAANTRMEDIRSTTYTALTSLFPLDYSTRYLRRVAGAWQVSLSDPGETVNINGSLLPVATTIRYLDMDGGVSSYDCFEIVVNAAYRPDSSDQVKMQSLYAR